MLTKEQEELAQLIIDTLYLEDVAPKDIDLDAPLFYEGLGLDSIDALELSIAISKKYGFELRSDNEKNKEIFSSLSALSLYVEGHRAKS
ncbi:MAG: phosphopantetheine-binding protein [Alphaproteobacteria bacterium]